MKLTASDFNKLAAFYRENALLAFKPGKRLLVWLANNYDVREVNGKVKMSGGIKDTIRQDLERDNPGLNLLAGIPPDATRLEMSKVMRDEKLAAINPDEEYVLIKAYKGSLALMDTLVPLPKETSLRLPVRQIPVHQYKTVLVVENLDVFDALPHYDMPLSEQTLLVYRGHDKGTSKGLKTFLTLAQNNCDICWFPDLDPKGLELAFVEKTVTQILSVDVKTDLAELREMSNSELFLKQHRARSHLKASLYSSHPLVSHVLHYQLAVMQQHLLSHRIKMKLYKICRT